MNEQVELDCLGQNCGACAACLESARALAESTELPPELQDYQFFDEGLHEFMGRAANSGERWEIDSLATADWALSRIADLEQEIAENDAVLEEHIARLRAKNDALNARAQRGMEFFTWHLQRWAEMNRETLLKGGKRKSRALHHGSIGWRKRPGGLQVIDSSTLLAWAEKQPAELGLVRYTAAPAVREIREWVEKQEELESLPPGLEVVEPKDEFVVKAVRQAPEVADGTDADE